MGGGEVAVTDLWGAAQQRQHNWASFGRLPKPEPRPRIAPAGMDLFTALRIAESVESMKENK